MADENSVYDEIFPGDDAVEFIEGLLEADEPKKAAWACRAMLSDEALSDDKRRQVESLLEDSMENPVNWKEAVLEWAEDPSLESWRELMQFVDLDDLYDRQRDAYAYLRTTDVDGDLLFRCLAESGMTPDIQELVDSGEVSPEVVGERAAKAPDTANGSWLALAARAAFARDDELGVIRWLKRAYNSDTDPGLVEIFTYELWSRADEQLRETLREQGWAPVGLEELEEL